jgi:hypothetical protein
MSAVRDLQSARRYVRNWDADQIKSAAVEVEETSA